MVLWLKKIYIHFFYRNHVVSFDKILSSKKVIDLLKTVNLETDIEQDPPIEIKNILSNFQSKYNNNELRLLIHLPSPIVSPGGYSVFLNIYESLNFMGIKTELLNWDDDFDAKFVNFQPNVFISSDDVDYKEKINWIFLKKYKQTHKLKIGLTASIEEYGNSPLLERIKWALENSIDFYYSFRSKEYTDNRVEYKPFFENGFEICNIEFGANLLKFFPVKNNKSKVFDYIFFGSTNFAKQQRYFDYFTPILKSKYIGLIWGPGWPWAKNEILLDDQKFYYANSKLALNLHLREQIDWPSELNERTYILAACKIPQLLDNPALLKYRFCEDSYFCATNPKNYMDLMKYMLQNSNDVKLRTEKMYEEVINKHTTFHRMEIFLSFINKLK